MKPGRPPIPPHRVKHGTRAGYFWHLNHDNEPCDACRDAERVYQAEHRALMRKRRDRLVNIIMGGHKHDFHKRVSKEEMTKLHVIFRKLLTKEQQEELGI